MEKKLFDLTGLHCAGCAANVERIVRAVPGVSDAYVNFAASRLTVQFDPDATSVQAIIDAVKQGGYGASPLVPACRFTMRETPLPPKPWLPLFFAAVLFCWAMRHAVFPALPLLPFYWEALIELALLFPILRAGKAIFERGFLALQRLSPDMDSLIAVGVTAALAYSVFLVARRQACCYYFDAAGMIVAFIMLGRYWEARSRRRAAEAVRELLSLMPETAHRINPDGSESDILPEEIARGDRLRIRAGERIPADGPILSGSSAVDESMLTGEAFPVTKEPGSPVTAGTVNGGGMLEMQCSGVGEETMLARIIQLVINAQGSRPPIARLADRVAGIFVPAVFALAALAFLLWYGAGRAAFGTALGYALSVLVVACPCALGLATPIALIVGISRGARQGILIKDAAALELAAGIKSCIFDKTGTLTLGKPEVVRIDVCTGFTQEMLLRNAAAAERGDAHPLAGAILRLAERESVAELPEITDFQSIPGCGVTCCIDNCKWRFGNLKLMSDDRLKDTDFGPPAKAGEMLFYAVAGGRPAGRFVVEDPLRPDAAAAVAALHKRHIQCLMLTGDRREAGRCLAAELGLDTFLAELLPGDKAAKIGELRAADPKNVIAMVGDGVNDAPALAAAHVGVAIGSGTGVAVEAADVVLPQNGLMGVVRMIDLSRATLRVIRQNLFWAFFYNLLGIPLAGGLFVALRQGPHLDPAFCAAAMAMSSLTVVLNALRLKKVKL